MIDIEDGSTTTTTADVSPSGLIKIAGATCGRVLVIDGEAYYEYKDRNRNRSDQRGAMLLRIRWRDFVESVELHLGSSII